MNLPHLQRVYIALRNFSESDDFKDYDPVLQDQIITDMQYYREQIALAQMELVNPSQRWLPEARE